MYKQMEEEEKQRDENLMHYAEKYGVATTDENGNPREIWEIEHDTQRASMWNTYKGIYKEELGLQQICSEVELECSEKIAECELVDKVADGTVNVLAEIVPGEAGKMVKDGRDLLKAPLVGASEAYAEGRSVTRGFAGGLVEGGATVLQNHLDDVVDGPTKDILDLGIEGGKKFTNDVISGKFSNDPNQTMEDVQNNLVKKTLDIGLGKVLEKTGMGEKGQNVTKEFLFRGHDEIKFGEGDDAKTLSEGITDTINNAKNETLAYGMYYTGMY